jgi:uncharacterized protein involved in type VI secretion and phage assembly
MTALTARHLESQDGGSAGLRYFGLHVGVVKEIADSQRPGQVKVSLPSLGGAGKDVYVWARLISLYADADQGWLIVPEVESEVVIGFEAGQSERAYVVGAVWNGKEALPDQPTKANNKRVMKTRSGSVLEFDDTKGSPKITLSTKGGHTLVLEDTPAQVTLHHSGGSQIVIDAAGKVNITATATVEVNANALNVHAPMAAFDGAITCTTLTASVMVSAPAYTPGAGNIW